MQLTRQLPEYSGFLNYKQPWKGVKWELKGRGRGWGDWIQIFKCTWGMSAYELATLLAFSRRVGIPDSHTVGVTSTKITMHLMIFFLQDERYSF